MLVEDRYTAVGRKTVSRAQENRKVGLTTAGKMMINQRPTLSCFARLACCRSNSRLDVHLDFNDALIDVQKGIMRNDLRLRLYYTFYRP